MKQSKKWKVGDVVQARGGGPIMTISLIDEADDSVQCFWFGTSNAHLLTGVFPADALVVVAASEDLRQR
jgi:uncharacterized protein YodC (DUF2158 family)